MATSYQRRPDGKAPDQRGVAARDAVELKAELQKLDQQKRALEQRGEESTIDAELAARLQPQMGNAAIAGLLNRATDTASAQAGDAALEQKEEKDEEKEEEGEDKEAGEVEQVLPSFSTAGGGGGGGGQPPWAMARQFGGDDDADAPVVEAAPTGWRPMPILPDPDEDAELEEVDDDAPPDPDGVDVRSAQRALGEAPWRPTVLSRGLRQARALARIEFAPESLVDADGLDSALGRARAMLRFVARHGDGLDAVVLARAAGAGRAALPAAGGYAGATARALALTEVALCALPPGWPRVLDVWTDPRARARVENVVQVVTERVGLGALPLFEAVVGGRVEPDPAELVLTGHPAAVAALEAAARVAPLPLVDLWEPSPRPPAPEGLDLVLARFTGGPTPRGPGLDHEDLGALFESLNHLLGALGGALVEVAAAGVAAGPHARVHAIAGVLAEADVALRRSARRLYGIGSSVEKLLGTEDHDAARQLSAEALAVRSTTELVRQSALATLGGLLLDSDPAPPELPELYARAEADAHAGRTAAARASLDAAILSAPPELEGRVRLAAGGLLLRMGLGDDGQLAESIDQLGGGLLAAGAASLASGLALSEERWAAAEHQARAGLAIGRDAGLPYVVADAACSVASARAHAGLEWRPVLVEEAAWLRAVEEGGALNLLKARWGELEVL